jgi:hypothetical protein
MLKYKDILKNFQMMDQQAAEKKILENANVEISPQMQQTLNEPMAHEGEMDKKDMDFLAMLIDMIDKKRINLYQPSSLFNHPVYDKLGEQAQGKAEMDAFNMLATIREIHKLWQAGQKNTYQIENLVHKIRVTKERLEEVGGDIFII